MEPSDRPVLFHSLLSDIQRSMTPVGSKGEVRIRASRLKVEPRTIFALLLNRHDGLRIRNWWIYKTEAPASPRIFLIARRSPDSGKDNM
jgi:hypothetical protein